MKQSSRKQRSTETVLKVSATKVSKRPPRRSTPSEGLCEDALDILQEGLHHNSNLRIRPGYDISFELGEGFSADIVQLPRLITSHVNETLSDDIRPTRKLDVKISVVERAGEPRVPPPEYGCDSRLSLRVAPRLVTATRMIFATAKIIFFNAN